MREKIIFIVALQVCFAAQVFGQEVKQKEVPSIILNGFKQLFPKAEDIEWKLKNGTYYVDFETKFSKTQKAWFSKTGKMVRHIQSVFQSDLPQKVSATLKKEYEKYRIDKIKKVFSDSKITYLIELRRKKEEINLVMSEDGFILNKKIEMD